MKLITGGTPMKDVQSPDTSCFSSLSFLATEPQAPASTQFLSCLRHRERIPANQPWISEAASQSQPYVFEDALVGYFATVLGDSEYRESGRCFHRELCGSGVLVITAQCCHAARKDFTRS